MVSPALKRLRVGLRRRASIASGKEFSCRDVMTEALVACLLGEVRA